MNDQKEIIVKLASRAGRIEGGTDLANQCPNNEPKWGRCRFVSNLMANEYDWLVLMDDFSPLLPNRRELLKCSRDHTILLTSEPSSVSYYGQGFSSQFKYVITNQDERALPHPNGERSQTGNVWYYGKPYSILVKEAPPEKDFLISTFCSSKKQKHTNHAKRFEFTQRLIKDIPSLDIYGHGVKPVAQKFEGIEPYKFHLVIENHIGPDVWSEKLADCFLGFSVPIYSGCPNISDYFPRDSYVSINLEDYEESLEVITNLIRDPNEYERRLDAVIEARQRVLEEYNLPSMLSHFIESRHNDVTATTSKKFLYSKASMRLRKPQDLLTFIKWQLTKRL